jgi:hypothetical protein
MKKIQLLTIALLFIFPISSFAQVPTCDDRMVELIKLVCIEPHTRHIKSAENNSTGRITCSVTDYATFWKKTNEIKDDLTREGITDLTPEQLANRYNGKDCNEVKLNATFDGQDVWVRFPGKDPFIYPIKGSSTMMTVAQDVINGEKVIRIVNVDYHNSHLVVEKDNGWVRQPDLNLEEATIVNQVNVTSLKVI